MIIKTAEFVTSAAATAQYPALSIPEVAFAGRSNVGKSSMINTLVNRKRLVKTSNTPGRTQLINFFNINDAFLLVDLPGYGFARVPQKVKQKWAPMIETYLSSRKTLKGVVIILDIRRIPNEQDQNMIQWLDHYQRKRILIATKADKLSRSKQNRQRMIISQALDVESQEIILFSAKTRQGKAEVLRAVSLLIDPLGRNGMLLTDQI